jgi:ubiquinone/menaquinone biosynthesis C-methylase UbiE
MATFHDFEHAQWQGAVEAYHAGWGALTTQAIPAALDAVEAGPGRRLLDVASGPGYLAAAAARRGADALGLDFSAAMVARARALHPAVAFQESDAEALPFAGGTFDAAAMNFGILHLARPETAIAEAHRVLRPGGRYAFTAWADPGRAAGFALVLDAVRRCGRLVALPAGPDFFRFSEPAECAAVLEAAGFEEPAVRRLDLRWRPGSPDDLFRAFLLGTARTGALLRGQDEAARGEIAAAVREAAAAYRAPEGGIEVPMPALLASASRRGRRTRSAAK